MEMFDAFFGYGIQRPPRSDLTVLGDRAKLNGLLTASGAFQSQQRSSALGSRAFQECK